MIIFIFSFHHLVLSKCYNFSSTAVTPPLCTPGCGNNAHCEYGQPNRCICNTGYSGNPYESCESEEEEKADCATTKCGTNAECRQGTNRVDCVCPVGFQGNPYVECLDVDECIGNACGMNAACFNTPGSFDCRCHEGFSGNPFQMCMSTTEPQTDPCEVDPSICMTCPDGCGPNAGCVDGSCVCRPGFQGNPNDVIQGCQTPGCRNNFDCEDNEICFSTSRRRVCIDACNKAECGPNAVCVAQGHRSSCLCKETYLGNPNDPVLGCQPADRESECDDNDDCSEGQVCQVDFQGLLACVDPCLSHNCGQNELCYVQNGRPLCRCEDGYLRNPSTNRCQSKYHISICFHLDIYGITMQLPP